MATTDDQRLSKLSRYFESIVHGESNIATSRHATLFIEAVCAQPDGATCAHRLTSGSSALGSIQSSVRMDISSEFLNGSAVHLLPYLEKSDIKPIASGQLLRSILGSLVEPPIFWNALTGALKSGQLQSPAVHSYAWLLCELLLVFPAENAKAYYIHANDPQIM